MNRRRLLITVFGVSVAALVWSRMSISLQFDQKADDMKVNAAAIEKLHARLTAGRFEEIYKDAFSPQPGQHN